MTRPDPHDPQLPPRLGSRRHVSGALTRLARKLARTGGWRHALVVGLIALSVAAAVGVAIVARSSPLPPEVQIAAQFGAAELRLERWVGHVTFEDLPPELQEFARDAGVRVDTVEQRDVAGAIARAAPGADVLPLERAYGRGARFDISYVSTDVAHPLADGLFRVDGPAPSEGEALLSPNLLGRLDAEVGEEVALPGTDRRVTVVGTVEDPTQLGSPLVILPAGASLPVRADWEGWLVDLPGAPSAAAVSALRNALEFSDGGRPDSVNVMTRWDAEQWQYTRQRITEEPSFIGVVVGAVLLLQVAFVSAAAFATGIRRRLRNLGLLGATGADPAHVRGLVLREAAVLGGVGVVLGIVLALAFAFTAGRPVAEALANNAVPNIRLHVLDLLGPGALGIAAALAAAYLPARTASRVPVTTALAGRMPVRDVPRWITPAALALSVLGLVVLATTIGSGRSGVDRTFLIGAGSVAAVLGAAALAAPLLGLVGRVADRLPARLRLAVRDTVRQRTRSASAVAALVVVLVIPVVGATSIATDAARWAVPEDLRRDLVSVSGPYYEGLQLPPTEDMVAFAEEHLPPVEERTTVTLVGPSPSRGGSGIALRGWTDGEVTRAMGASSVEFWPSAAVATPELLDALDLSHLTAEVTSGTVVFLDLPNVFRPGGVPDSGQVTLAVASEARPVSQPGTEPAAPSATEREVPVDLITIAPGVATYDLPELLLPPDLADDLALQTVGRVVLLDLVEPLTADAARSLEQLGSSAPVPFNVVSAANTFTLDPTVPTLIVLGAALLLALIIGGMTTALAATESDHDLQLMTAVGADPTIRRAFHGVQAGYHALLAAVLAVPAGLLVYVAGVRDMDTVVPYGWLAVIVLGIPALVAAVHAAAMRNSPVRAPRRIA